MATLPALPNLDQLRHQAKDLLRAAQSGDAAAAAQLAAVSDRPTLSAAQVVVARSYGFLSWPRLKAEVEARTASMDEKAAEFCVASVRDWTGKAVRMLAETPELAGYNLATALILGDVNRVRAEIERDPAVVNRPDPLTGWTALHAVSASRWGALDPGRAEGLVATARLLLGAGADPGTRVAPGGPSAGSSPLHCATAAASAGAGNAAIMGLLLEYGAAVEDEDLYLAAFSRDDDHRCLRVLLEQAPYAASAAEKALSAPISTGDVEGVRLLLEAGEDPRRFADDEGVPSAAVYHAVRLDAPAVMIALLIEYGADPDQPGPDGLTPALMATIRGRSDLVELLGGSGVTEDARFVGACMRGDRAAAVNMKAADPALPGRLTQAEQAAIVHAAEAGNEPAVSLMLDLGFPIGVRRDDGATALHAAAYAGSVPVVRLLINRGADLEALDGQFESPALGWALVGSRHRPQTSPHPDWVTTVRALIEAGASTQDLTLSPDDPTGPSAEVADLLRAFGVGSTA
jgi:ankyrin repeat protein